MLLYSWLVWAAIVGSVSASCFSDGREYSADKVWRDSRNERCKCETKTYQTRYGSCPVYWAKCTPSSPCQHDKPVDLFFLLDASSSIKECNFCRQRGFVKEIVSTFDMEKTRVSIRTFSHTVDDAVPLKRYKDYELYYNIDTSVKYMKGGTRTDLAIKAMRNEAQRRSGSNIKISFVITDGASQHLTKTIQEAESAHSEGIWMFAIGVGGNVSQTELNAIASDPDRKFVSTAVGYPALKDIRDTLLNKTCKVVKNLPMQQPTTTLVPTMASATQQVTKGLTTPAATTTTTTMPPKPTPKVCTAVGLDFFFLVDESHGMSDDVIKRELMFVKNIMAHYDGNKTELNVDRFSDTVRSHGDVSVRLYRYRTDLNKDLDDYIRRNWGERNTTAALEHMIRTVKKWRESAFRASRDRRTQVGIVMTGGRSTNPRATVEMAKAARDNGIVMLAVFFGTQPKGVRAELGEIASDSDYVYMDAEKDAGLQPFIGKMVRMTCSGSCVMDGKLHPVGSWIDTRRGRCECRVETYSYGGTRHCPIHWAYCTRDKPLKCLQNKQIDVFFLLDSSRSPKCNFYKKLPFVKDIIASFDLKNTRVSIRTFAKSVHLFAKLQRRNLSDLYSIIDGIDGKYRMSYTRRTNTHLAIRDMIAVVKLSPTKNIKIAFLISDDLSSHIVTTKRYAKEAREIHGISIFASNIDGRMKDNLKRTVGGLDKVIMPTAYSTLNSLNDELSTKICKVVKPKPTTTPKPTTPKPTTPKPTTQNPKPTTQKLTTPKPSTLKPPTPKPSTLKPPTPKPTTPKPTTHKPTTPKPTTTPNPTTPISRARGPYKLTKRKTTQEPPPPNPSACAKCKKLKGIDIFFIMANSISTDKNDFAKQLAFVKKVTSRFHVPCTRVSVTVANDNGPPVRPLDCVCNLKDIFSSNTNGPNVTIGQFGGKVSTGDAIASMRREARDNKGENRSMIAVVITNGVSRDTIRTRDESEMVREESKMAQVNDGFVMYAIGVGKKTNQRELGHIASDPDRDHVFVVENYSALDNIVHMVAKKAGVDLTAGGAVGRK